MKHSFLALLGIALLASSCAHKDYEEPTQETPAFSVTGLRNGEPFTLSAGDNGLIQTATLERNKYGVMEWTSSFATATCPTCDPEFSITINDSEGVNLNDCSNAEIFANSQLLFAQETSTSDFEECQLSIDGVEEISDINFVIPGSNPLSATTFSLDTEGLYQVTADFELEIEGSPNENGVRIHQTIYAGAHQRVSAPFLYEVLEAEENEQELRLLFPNIPGLRATHWEVNGIADEQASIVRSFPTNGENRIELFYINDLTGLEGSYAIRFNRGFPADEACDEDHHIMPAPSINVDWATGQPNHERVFITYRWQGKTYVSTTPLNSNQVLALEGTETFEEGLQGNNALKLKTTFSVTLVEVGNETNLLELTNCRATFGFVTPQ